MSSAHWRMSCDIAKAMEGLENKLWCRWRDRKVGEWALLILQTFHHFTYVTAHSPTLPSLYLCHSSFSNEQSSFSNLSVTSHVTAHSPTLLSLYLRHSSFSNLSLTSPTSQALHLIHLDYMILLWQTHSIDFSMFKEENHPIHFKYKTNTILQILVSVDATLEINNSIR